MGRRPDQQRTTVIVLAVVGIGLVAICLVSGAFVGLVVMNPDRPGAVPAKKIYDREEFREVVKQKTQDQILQLLGTPDRTDRIGGNSTWIYREVTRDRVTGKIDSSTHVEFRNGVVVGIIF